MITEDLYNKDNEVKCYINIGDEEKEILLRLNVLQAAGNKKIFQCINLVSALFLFSIAFFAYSVQLSSAWIYLMLSLLFIIVGLSCGKIQRAFFRGITEKSGNQTKFSQKREYLFSKEGVDILSELGRTHNYWSSFVSRGEIEHYIYLMRKDHNIVLIDKNELSHEGFIVLQQLIENKEIDHIVVEEQGTKENKTSSVIKGLVFITVITVIVSLGYIGIKTFYPLSQGQVFRLWFARTLPIILLLILQCLDLIWSCVLSKIIKLNQKKSLLKRIILWVVGMIVILAMALGIFVHLLNDDSEHYNGDGTVVIKSPVWLDDPEFYLYREENLLVLRYLRDAKGIEDIDSSITQDEYINKEQDRSEKKNNDQNEAEQESEQDSEIYQNDQETAKNNSIDEGYQKVYETYIENTGIDYKKDYNAKGNSYVIVYEDETQIRYLMYDRDEVEGEKAQYVYYQNEKNLDGSWSPTDSEILGMYQYDYESKEVKDLEKTTW